jgi:hypothetical protein
MSPRCVAPRSLKVNYEADTPLRVTTTVLAEARRCVTAQGYEERVSECVKLAESFLHDGPEATLRACASLTVLRLLRPSRHDFWPSSLRVQATYIFGDSVF